MSLIRYKIDFTWSDGTPRSFPTWGEIHNRIYNRFGSARAAYNAYLAFTRDREGWVLSTADALSAHQWRAVLEETFAEYSRPACAVVIVRRIVDGDASIQSELRKMQSQADAEIQAAMGRPNKGE